MKKITLRKIEFNGFYGQSRKVDFGDKTIIRGGTKKGKTTIANAFFWCLMGVDIFDRQNYKLFSQYVPADVNNAQTAIVSAYLDIDGESLKLTRQARQKYERARGSVEYVKASSDEYKYFIDDLEVGATKYNEVVESTFAPTPLLKLIANIGQWRLIKWDALRKHFQTIIGEILPTDFSQDYSEVLAMLRSADLETIKASFRKQVAQHQKSIDAKLSQIYAEKATLRDETYIEKAKTKIAELEAEIAEIDKQIMGVSQANSSLIAKRNQEQQELYAKKAALEQLGLEHKEKHYAQARSLRNKIANTLMANAQSEQLKQTLEASIADDEQLVVSLESQRSELLKLLDDLRKRAFSGLCPTCGAVLTDEMRAELMRSFQANRQAKEDATIMEGKRIRNRIDSTNARIAESKARLNNLAVVDVTADQQLLSAIETNFVPFEKTPEAQPYIDEIARLEAALTSVSINDDAILLQQRKADILVELKQQTKLASAKDINEEINNRIALLEVEKEASQSALVEAKRMLDLVNSYERELAVIIKNRANQYFPERSEVVMTGLRKNNDIDYNVCDIIINGCNAMATNTADRMNAGIDVSTAFMRAMDINFPLFVDGAESIVDIESYGRQAIIIEVDKNNDNFNVIVQ